MLDNHILNLKYFFLFVHDKNQNHKWIYANKEFSRNITNIIKLYISQTLSNNPVVMYAVHYKQSVRR